MAPLRPPMNALQDLATQYRLPLMAQRLRDLALAAPAPTEPADPAAGRWARIARHGLTSAHLQELLTLFRDHPFERGLLAWDGLNASLLRDDELLRALRAASRPVTPLLTDRRRGHSITAPFERVMRAASLRWQGAGRRLLDEAIAADDFGALWLERGRLTPDDRARLLAHIARLDRAHLETTAQVGARLAFSLGERSAARLWVESMLDHDDERVIATHRQLGEGAPAGYVEARRALQRLDFDDATKHIARLAADSPEAIVTRGELASKRGEPTSDLEALRAINAAQPEWRYAARVLVTAVAAGGSPLDDLARFITSFGHDLELWLDLLRIGKPEHDWFPDLIAQLTGHLVASPHSRVLWTLVAALVDSAYEDERSTDELTARITEQSAQPLAGQ